MRKIIGFSLLVAAGAFAGAAAAQPDGLRGSVNFVGDTAIPAGQIAITLEDTANRDSVRLAPVEAALDSNGKSTIIPFAIEMPATVRASRTLQIVARLERADGWLLARGSAPYTPGTPIEVTLNPAMY